MGWYSVSEREDLIDMFRDPYIQYTEAEFEGALDAAIDEECEKRANEARGGAVNAREDLINAIGNEDYFPVCFWPCATPCQIKCPTPEDMVDKYRDEVALQLGRDCLEMGLVPFLERLVGPENTTRLFERHAGEVP